jgi:hypothetical protein
MDISLLVLSTDKNVKTCSLLETAVYTAIATALLLTAFLELRFYFLLCVHLKLDLSLYVGRKVYENKVTIRTFGPETEKGTKSWRTCIMKRSQYISIYLFAIHLTILLVSQTK